MRASARRNKAFSLPRRRILRPILGQFPQIAEPAVAALIVARIASLAVAPTAAGGMRFLQSNPAK